jgi:nucleotide-binding universal stress UspA family protein
LAVSLDGVIEHLHKQADEYLQGVAKGLESAGISTTTDVRSGPAIQHIVNEAERASETLIAMSTHGRTGIGRLIMGSVTDGVVQTAKAPVLVVRPESDSPATSSTASIKTIIVPLDVSELAEAVIPIVVAFAKAVSAEVLLARAVSIPSSFYSSADYSAPINIDFLSDMEDEAAAYLGQQAEPVKKSGVASVTTAVLRGGATAEIENLSRNTPDSMIVISTHGRTGVGRTVLGSIADHLARHSGEPVLLVRPA